MALVQINQKVCVIDIVFGTTADVDNLIGQAQPAQAEIGQASALSGFFDAHHELFILFGRRIRV